MTIPIDQPAGVPDAVALARPVPSVPWKPLPRAKNIDDVIRNLDQIIDWAIQEESTIGYFAVLYKRSTVAIRVALEDGTFTDRAQMENFDVVFASRYFDALNAYFSEDANQDDLTLPWEAAFVGETLNYSTMLQHMIAGLNAHINFDLGIATAQVVPTTLQVFRHDFILINAIVASQVRGTLSVAEVLSPRVKWIRRAIPSEIKFIRSILVKFRKSAWGFAIFLANKPDRWREKTVEQTAWAAALGAWYLSPPHYWRAVIPRILNFIGEKESRDIAANLKALNENANDPDPLDPAYLKLSAKDDLGP